MKLIVATNNKGKLLEIEQILEDSGIELLPLSKLDISVEFEETGTTFEENAIIKAKTLYDLKKMPVLADDSGLVVDALGGAPGIYTSRYAGEHATDDENIDKLLNAMKDVSLKNRTARFVCAIAYIDEVGHTSTYVGQCEGMIAYERKGRDGMGYDPIFYYPPFEKTFAQLTDAQKNSVSHRNIALQKWKEKIIK